MEVEHAVLSECSRAGRDVLHLIAQSRRWKQRDGSLFVMEESHWSVPLGHVSVVPKLPHST